MDNRMGKYKMYIQTPPAFSREWWGETGRNLFWVSIVTILIWVYADMEFTTSANLNVTVSLSTGNTQSLVLLSSPTAEINFTVEGNRSNIEGFKRRLNEMRWRLRYDLSQGYAPGLTDVRVTDLLTNALRDEQVSMAGLSIQAATPSAIRVHLDKLVVLESVQVELDYTGATLAGLPEIKPDRLDVLVPQGDLDKIKALERAGTPRVIRTRAADLKGVAPGKPYTFNTDLIPYIGNVMVHLGDKTSVRVTLEVSQRLDSKKVKIPVQILTPNSWVTDGSWQQYELEKKDSVEWLKEVTVIGSPKDLGNLKSENIQAFVTLTEEDKTPVASWLTREITVRFPAELNLQLAPGEKPTVSFKLNRR